jgi:assimilatory nitrate reductase catalytic subunit
LRSAAATSPPTAAASAAKGGPRRRSCSTPARVTEPLLKGPDGVFRPISWDEALGRVTAAVKDARASYGRDSVGVFGGGGLTNEKAYQLGKFARLALGTSRIDYNGRFCMSSAAAAGMRAFGLDRGLPFPLEALDTASTILMLGSNVAETMPPFVQHLQGVRDAGGLIVVDPRRSATAAFTADGGGLHLQPLPGTDLALLLGISHVVIHEGLLDADYIQARTTGFDAVVRSVNAYWPERVQSITGVPADLIRETARRLAAGARRGGSYILTGRGVEQHVDGTDTATAAINLSLLLGLPGSARSGYGTLTGQGNGQGGREHGQKADQLPGYRKITDPAARAHMAAVWGVDESLIPGPGLPAVQLLKSLGQPDGVRCLFVHASNIAVASPDANAVIRGLRSLDFLVVCDFFMSETAAEADLVLPVLQWAEEEGTLTNLEGRVLRRRQAPSRPPVPAANCGSWPGWPRHSRHRPPTATIRRRSSRSCAWPPPADGRLLRHRLRHAGQRRSRVLALPRRQHRNPAHVPGQLRPPGRQGRHDPGGAAPPSYPAAILTLPPNP